MAGAVIPNDWDGTSYRCYRVQWPQSLQYEAILLGQVSTPTEEQYWDPDTGDVAEAREGVEQAYIQTLTEFPEQECGGMTPGIPVPTFKATTDKALTLFANVFVPIEWNQYIYNLNSPDFSLVENGHEVTNPDLFGLWHYDVILRSSVNGSVLIRSKLVGTGERIAQTRGANGTTNLSFDYVWTAAGETLITEFNSINAATLNIQSFTCQFSGQFIGPTE